MALSFSPERQSTIVSQDAIQRTKEELQALRNTIGTLKNKIVQEPKSAEQFAKLEKIKRIEELTVQAQNGLQSIILQFNTKRSPDAIKPAFDAVVEQYKEAVSLKTELLNEEISPHVGGVLDGMIDKTNLGPKKVLLEKLRDYVSMLEGGGKSRLIGIDREGKSYPNFEEMQKVKTLIADIRRTFGELPEGFDNIVSKINESLHTLASSDPTRSFFHELNLVNKAMGPNMGAKPLRLLGAITGGLIAGFGLTGYAYQKMVKGNEGITMSWLIPGWALASFGMVNPTFFGSKETQAIAKLQNVPWNDLKDWIGKGFYGDKGEEALADLAKGAKKPEYKKLLAQDKISKGVLAQIFGSQSPLTIILSQFKSDQERAKALHAMQRMAQNLGKKDANNLIGEVSPGKIA